MSFIYYHVICIRFTSVSKFWEDFGVTETRERLRNKAMYIKKYINSVILTVI